MSISGTAQVKIYQSMTTDDLQSVLLMLGLPAGQASTVAAHGSAEWLSAVANHNGWSRRDAWARFPVAMRELYGTSSAPAVTVDRLSQQERESIAQAIASEWRGVCASLNIEQHHITNNLSAGASPLDCARMLVQQTYNRCIPVATLRTAALRYVNLNGVTCLGGECAAQPTTFTQGTSVLNHDASAHPVQHDLSSAVMAIDDEEHVVTMREIMRVAGHKTVAKLIAALDNGDAWQKVLKVPHASPKIAASLAAINAKLINAKAADDDYNVPYNMLRILCETNKFGNMAVSEFVQTVLAPVPALQKTAAKILSELEQSERKKSDALHAATTTLINWNEMITDNGLKLAAGASISSVIAALNDLGVESHEDLVHAEVDDLVRCGFKKVSATKLKALIEAQSAGPRSHATGDNDED